MTTIEIGPSIIAADYMNMARDIDVIARGGADIVHVDVMDGHFVPNLTIGPPVVESLRRVTDLPLDCHLMIEDPDRWLTAFIDAGAHRISVHVEACRHLHRTIHAIREGGVLAGAALNPATPASALDAILPDLDFVLVMSVNPGFSGQAFIEASVQKIEILHERIQQLGLQTFIQVDGGVGVSNIQRLVQAGARSLVAGSSVFGHRSPVEAISELRTAAGVAV